MKTEIKIEKKEKLKRSFFKYHFFLNLTLKKSNLYIQPFQISFYPFRVAEWFDVGASCVALLHANVD